MGEIIRNCGYFMIYFSLKFIDFYTFQVFCLVFNHLINIDMRQDDNRFIESWLFHFIFKKILGYFIQNYKFTIELIYIPLIKVL